MKSLELKYYLFIYKYFYVPQMNEIRTVSYALLSQRREELY